MSKNLIVVLAAYNGKKYLDEQLASIFGQQGTVSIKEVLLVDDCSSEDLDGFYSRLQKKYMNRLKIVRSRVNRGVVGTFEYGIDLALERGADIVALSDQDDVWLPNKLSDSMALLPNEGVGLVYTDLSVVNEDLSLIAESKWKYSRTPPISGSDSISLILKNPVSGCTCVMTKELAEAALPFPADIPMHDWWLALVASERGALQYLDQPTMLYRQHSLNEVGGLPFGLKGFLARVKGGGGDLVTYLNNRLKNRVVLLSLIKRGAQEDKLIDYYSSSFARRLLLSPWYLSVIYKEKEVLGFLNIFFESLLTIFTLRRLRR